MFSSVNIKPHVCAVNKSRALLARSDNRQIKKYDRLNKLVGYISLSVSEEISLRENPWEPNTVPIVILGRPRQHAFAMWNIRQKNVHCKTNRVIKFYLIIN